MIYVLADIHGQKRRFDSILAQIDLQPDDDLYVLGDVIDRNPDGIQLLRKIMAMPNAKMLLGNHELMMLRALYYSAPDSVDASAYYEKRLDHWYRNGGDVTHRYLKRIRKETRLEIFDFLDRLPLNYEITVNGRDFVLAHAAPAKLYYQIQSKYDNERDFAVWQRFDTFPPMGNQTVIFGHTPTIHYTHESPMSVWQGDGWIGIDCGCMLPEDGDPYTGVQGRLACLRLDDMKIFYSEEN